MPLSLKIFLWVAVVAAAIGLGAKLFDLIILAPAWGASPPSSLRLMPYGPEYPLNPGDFFIPVSLLIVVSYIGALAVGRNAARWHLILLILPVAFVAIGGVATPTLFWVMIRELYGAGAGRIERTDAELVALVRRWFVLDTIRTLLVAGGLACHIALLNMPYRTRERRH